MPEDYKKQLEQQIRSASAKNAARKRHKENHEIKKDAIEFYRKHHAEFKNKDAAAMHISQKIAPVAFATARDWLKGKNQSDTRIARALPAKRLF